MFGRRMASGARPVAAMRDVVCRETGKPQEYSQYTGLEGRLFQNLEGMSASSAVTEQSLAAV